jgi:hypothetical protein
MLEGRRKKKAIMAYWKKKWALYCYIAAREKKAAEHTGGGDGYDIEEADSCGKLGSITGGDGTYSEAVCQSFRSSWRWELFDAWYVMKASAATMI